MMLQRLCHIFHRRAQSQVLPFICHLSAITALLLLLQLRLLACATVVMAVLLANEVSCAAGCHVS